MRKLLTAATVHRIPSPATGRVEIHDSVVPALALMITSNGARSYILRGRIGNRPQRGQNPIRVTLGGVGNLTLAEAREQASNLLRMMRRGEDRERSGELRHVMLTSSAEPPSRVSPKPLFPRIHRSFVAGSVSPLISVDVSLPHGESGLLARLQPTTLLRLCVRSLTRASRPLPIACWRRPRRYSVGRHRLRGHVRSA